MEKWKILKETDVSPSKWFPIVQHTVRLSDHTVVDDYFISPLGNVAMVLPITSKNEIVFVKQYKHGVKEVLIELPGGFQQEGKSVEESALAELHEETGIKVSLNDLEPLGKITNVPTKLNNITYLFLTKNVSFNSVQNLDANEDIEIVKITPVKALEMIKNGEIWSADTVSAIMMAYLKYTHVFSIR